MKKSTTVDWIRVIDSFAGREDRFLAGVDESGRGPLAGPVIAAAVILDPNYRIEGLADSKTLNPQTRERLAVIIQQHTLSWSLGRADIEEIDSLNILQATMLAMQRAVTSLSVVPKHVLIDGNHCPPLECLATAVVKGDAKVPAISAASILAKVARDSVMGELDIQYPVYGFAKHKGYPTRAHLRALREHGPCVCHRRSFSPVRKLIGDKVVRQLSELS